MDCKQVADDQLVEKYLTGQLEPSAQDAFELHLLECPQCVAYAEALQCTRDALVEREHEIRAFPVKPARRIPLLWLGVAAAVTLVAVIVIYQFLRTIPGGPEKARVPPVLPKTTPVVVSNPQNAKTVPANSTQVKPPVVKLAKKPGDATTTVPPGPSEQPKTPIPSPPVAPQVASEQPNHEPKTNPDKPKPSSGLSEQAALELYRLGAVQAPPADLSATGQSASPSTSRNNPKGLAENPSTGAGRSLFQKAMLAYMDKNYAAAADLLEKSLQTDPEALNAKFYLGVCRLLEGRPAGSVAPLKAVIAAPAGVLTQAGHFYLAKAYLQMGKLDEAENEMRSAAALPGRLTAQARSVLAGIQKVRESAAPPDHSGALPHD